jgi:type IV pilus assembly protein PilB
MAGRSAVPPPAPHWATSSRNVGSPAVAELPAPANDPPQPTDAAAPTAPRRLRLGEVLVRAGVCDEHAIKRALAVQQMGGGRLGAILVNLRLCTEPQIRSALSEQLGIEVVDLQGFKPDNAVLGLLPREMIRKYEAIPLRREGNTFHVALKDPYNLTAIDDIRFHTGCHIVVNICTETEFARFLEEHLASASLMDEILEGGRFYERAIQTVEPERHADAADNPQMTHELRIAGEQAPIVTLCNFLLVESISRRASDIHIEPYESYFRVRLRIDGALQTLITPPQRLHGAMITRLKIMADMDIAKRRCPQDGHIGINYQGEICHFRVSTLPTVYGEKCVIRLLKKDAGLQSIDSIGFAPQELDHFRKALRLPQGIILVTGPTGSGKTTTLHAGLAHINDTELNIVTLEDPVEASIPGINHVQINVPAGVTFASGLRSILRQDPDVVFVGEMRDEEVSQIAVKAALTGHLVLSTLHTNSAAESMMRLVDLGIPAYLLANALVMIIAQRLMRKVCTSCSKPRAPTAEDRCTFDLDDATWASAKLREAKGCSNCHDSGYRGRIAVYEVMRVTSEMRILIRSGATVEQILECARTQGFRGLYESGLAKALAGETTLAEVTKRLVDAA